MSSVFFDARRRTFVDSYGLVLPSRPIKSPTEIRPGELVARDDKGNLYAVTPLTADLSEHFEINSVVVCPRCRQVVPLKAVLKKFFETERDPDELLAVFTYVTKQIRHRLKEAVELVSKVRQQAEVDPELKNAVQDIFEGVLYGVDAEED